MKRLVLFGIVIFLIIIGGFLVVDKVWLHKVFKITPGSCLILEEKYCKTGEIKYEDNKPIGIVYKIKDKTPLFSPITDEYSFEEITINNNSGNQFSIGMEMSVNGDTEFKNGYQILFSGIYVSKINKNSNKKIVKGYIFAYTNKEMKEVYLIPTLNKTTKVDFGNSIEFKKETLIDEETLKKMINNK